MTVRVCFPLGLFHINLTQRTNCQFHRNIMELLETLPLSPWWLCNKKDKIGKWWETQTAISAIWCWTRVGLVQITTSTNVILLIGPMSKSSQCWADVHCQHSSNMILAINPYKPNGWHSPGQHQAIIIPTSACNDRWMVKLRFTPLLHQ